MLLLLIDVAAKAELAAQHDGLGDKAALLPAPVGAAANLVAFVADCGIGVQRGLPGFRFERRMVAAACCKVGLFLSARARKASSLSGARESTPWSSWGAGPVSDSMAGICIEGCGAFWEKEAQRTT